MSSRAGTSSRSVSLESALAGCDRVESQSERGFRLSGGTSTGELLTRVRVGDAAAAERVLHRVLPMLFRHAHGKLPRAARGPIDTSDVVQDVIIAVLPRLEGFDPAQPEKLRAYLKRSVTNRIIDELRRAQVRGPRVDLDGPSAPEFPSTVVLPDEDASWREDFELYLEALKMLRPSDRELVVARFHFGFAYKKIAQLTDRSGEDAARMAVSRAVSRLEDELARRGGSPSAASTRKK